MRPLTGSMSGTNTGYAPPQYKFSDDLKWVEIAGYVQTPAATGNYNGTVFKTLPANYQPVTTQGHKWLVTLVADGPFGTPMVSVLPSGAVQFGFLPTSLAQTILGIGGRYPLEDQAGFLQS